MTLIMAFEETASGSVSLILKIKESVDSTYNIGIEVDQVSISVGRTLRTADTMWIVTGIAGCFQFNNMFIMN